MENYDISMKDIIIDNSAENEIITKTVIITFTNSVNSNDNKVEEVSVLSQQINIYPKKSENIDSDFNIICENINNSPKPESQNLLSTKLRNDTINNNPSIFFHANDISTNTNNVFSGKLMDGFREEAPYSIIYFFSAYL